VSPDPLVHRAPLRSRRDDIDPAATLERALTLGLCGFGDAVDAADIPRWEARIERFAAVPEGSFVWTRDGDGLFRLGRIDGPYRHDTSAAARAVDLVHVRDCTWAPTQFIERDTPPAVVATFERGGRNFQRIHDDAVGQQTLERWPDD
jgi:hypothetical protein